MSWVKLDDAIGEHRKVVALEDYEAPCCWLNVKAIAWSNRQLADGLVPKGVIRRLAGTFLGRLRMGQVVITADELTKRLIDAGLWIDEGEFVRIHDYLDYQPSKDQIEQRRQYDSRKAALYRDFALVEYVKTRDGTACRYCGKEVSWEDRRGSRGAVLEHVNPMGGNTPENVVVACRSCNTRKGGRSLDQAGMVLGPIQNVPDTNQVHRTPRPDPARSGPREEKRDENGAPRGSHRIPRDLILEAATEGIYRLRGCLNPPQCHQAFIEKELAKGRFLVDWHAEERRVAQFHNERDVCRLGPVKAARAARPRMTPELARAEREAAARSREAG